MRYPVHLAKLIEVLKRLPGVGRKSAERFAFQMLGWKPVRLKEMADAISAIPQELCYCLECGCLMGKEECPVCTPVRKETGILCVVAYPKDVFLMENTQVFRGLYHVLGGLLSPLEGVGPQDLTLDKLKERIKKEKIQEIVIALDATLEGDATALFLKQELDPLSVKLSRLALGLPMGCSFEYLDEGTLARAFSSRSHL